MHNYHAIHSTLIQYFNSVIFCVFKTLTLQYSFIPKKGFRNAGDIINNGTSAFMCSMIKKKKKKRIKRLGRNFTF